MSQSASRDRPSNPDWEAVLEDTDSLFLRIARINRATDLVALVRSSLKSPMTRIAAMRALAHMDQGITLQVLPELVDIAAHSHRDALLARQAIGRLPYEAVARRLSDVVMPRLPTADDDEYRRLAELLDHLGLYDLLRTLVDAALASDDVNTREVGEDFRA